MALSRYSYCFAIVVRKSFTLFLLLIFLVQVMGCYFAFRLRQIELKNEVHSYLKTHTNDNHLTHFQLKLQNGVVDEQFEWENENEFQHEGKMYDVIERTITGNIMVMHCLEDKKETELLKVFEQTEKNQSQQGKNRTASLQQILGSLYLPIHITLITPIEKTAECDFSIHTSSPIERAADILTPPPQNC